MFWQDIYEKTGAAPDILACQPSVIDSIEEREAALLDEVHELCEKNDIEYVLSGYLTARALNGENPGSSVKEKNIYMNIENAMRFVDVFEKSGIAGRELLSFNNCSSLIDFKLIYNDKDSVFLRFDRINEWEGVGAHINIIILRRRHKSLLIDKYILLKEIVLSVVNIHPVDKGVLRKKMRKLLYLIAKIYVNIVGKQKYSKKLYNHIVKRETAYIGTDTNYFYRKNKNP